MSNNESESYKRFVVLAWVVSILVPTLSITVLVAVCATRTKPEPPPASPTTCAGEAMDAYIRCTKVMSTTDDGCTQMIALKNAECMRSPKHEGT